MADLDDVFLAAAADPSVAALIEDARPVFLFDRRGSRLLFVNAAGAAHLGIGDRAAFEDFRLQPGHPTARRVAAIDGQLGPGQARTDRVPLSRSVVPQSVVCRASRFRFAGERGILLVALDAVPRDEDPAAARAAFERLFAAEAAPADSADEPAVEPADAELAIAEAPALVAEDEPAAVVTTALPPDEPLPASLHDAMDLPDLGADYGQDDPTAGAADPDAEAAGTGFSVPDDEGAYGDAPDEGVSDEGAGDDAGSAEASAFETDTDLAPVHAETGEEAVEAVAAEPDWAAEAPVADLPEPVEAALEREQAVDDAGEPGPAVHDAVAPEQAVVDAPEPELAVDTAGEPEPVLEASPTEAPEADDPAGDEQAAPSETAGFRFPDHGRSVRFVFELDDALAFAFVSDDLSGVVGPAASPQLGDTWADLAARMDLDPRGRVQSALARHDTFTGLTVDWPVEGGALRLPVDLAGMPVFARDRAFRGYRGFGIAKTGAAFSIAPPAVPTPAVESAEETVVEAVDEGVNSVEPALVVPVSDDAADAALDVVEHQHVAEAEEVAIEAPAPDEAEVETVAEVSPGEEPTGSFEEAAAPVDPSGGEAIEVISALPEAGHAGTDERAPEADSVSGPDGRPVEDETGPDAGEPAADTEAGDAEAEPEPALEPSADAAPSEPTPAPRGLARGDGLAAALLAAAAAAAVAGHRLTRGLAAPAEPVTTEPQAASEDDADETMTDPPTALVEDAARAPEAPVAVPLADDQPDREEPEGVVIGLDPDRIYAAESLLFGGMTEAPPPEDAVFVAPAETGDFALDDGPMQSVDGTAVETGPDSEPVSTIATEEDGDPQPEVDEGFAALEEAVSVGVEPDQQPETWTLEPMDLEPAAPERDATASDDDGSAFEVDETADADAIPQDGAQPTEPLDLVEEPDPASNDVAWSERSADVIPSPVVARSVPPEPPLSAADAARRQLSRPEREAFQKIAEALGARLHDSHRGGRADDRPAVEAPSAGPADAPSRAVPIRAPAAETPQDTGDDADGTVVRGPFAAAGPMLDLAVLDRLPVAVALLRHGEAIAANRAFLDLAGYSDLAALDAAGGFAEAFVGSPLIRDHRLPAIRRRDGVEVPVHVRLHSVPFEGAMASMLVVQETAKATGPVRAETAEARVGELEAILDTATDGVLLIDTSGRILGANRSAEALFGAEREAMVGAPLIDYLAPESHRNALDYLDGLSRNGVASVLNDGREVIGRVRRGGLVPLFMTVGRVSAGRFCAVLRDITSWKRAEEELTTAKRSAENASSQKSDFLAKISHEIRTPLNAIIGFSEVMMEERFGPVGSERYKEYLRDIHMSGSLIMSLVNDLLDLSKIEAGKLDLAFEAVPVNEVVRECVALMQPQANRERIIIRTSLSSSLPNVVADHRSLRQIVLNLLSNAIKFNQPGGQVIVSTLYEDSGEVALRVRDTGPGMSADDVEKALEPFRQLHTTRPGRGTGLGLPLTKALVEANRAAFRIDSAPGQGTLVQVTFPSTRVLAE